MASSPVKEAALEAGLHVYQPESIKSESSQDFLKRIAPDAVVIIAYGQIVPARLWRSRASVGSTCTRLCCQVSRRGADTLGHRQRQKRYGLTTMQIDAGMDTGPILLQRQIEIGPNETSPGIIGAHERSRRGTHCRFLAAIRSRRNRPAPQPSAKISHAPILKKENGRIDGAAPPNTLTTACGVSLPGPERSLHFEDKRAMCGGVPKAAAGETNLPGEIVSSAKELFVACGGGTQLRVEFVQLEGRKKISAQEFANGARLVRNDRFV